MSHCLFCNLDPMPGSAGQKPRDGKRPSGILRRMWRGLQWLLPTMLLVLTPKCPMCVIGYVALFTGIGIGVSTARWIQILMPVVGLISLAYLAFGLWHRRCKGRRIPVSS